MPTGVPTSPVRRRPSANLRNKIKCSERVQPPPVTADTGSPGRPKDRGLTLRTCLERSAATPTAGSRSTLNPRGLRRCAGRAESCEVAVTPSARLVDVAVMMAAAATPATLQRVRGHDLAERRAGSGRSGGRRNSPSHERTSASSRLLPAGSLVPEIHLRLGAHDVGPTRSLLPRVRMRTTRGSRDGVHPAQRAIMTAARAPGR